MPELSSMPRVKMIKEYSEVKIKKNGFIGHVVEYDDNGGKDLPIYLVELDPEFYEKDEYPLDWFEEDELEVLSKW